MPSVKFPVVLTACKTSREVWPVLETLTRASDINATDVLCQVKKKMNIFTGRILHLFRGPDLQKDVACSENGGYSFGGI